MTALLYLLGVVVFVVAILASIGLHELGHMIPAKRFGGKVTQYFIGFGPTVWSKQVGETEYGLKAVPFGGYVRIVGMFPPAAAEAAEVVEVDAAGNQVVRLRRSDTGMFTQLIADARAAEYETIRPEDSERLFYKLPVWKQVVVMAGGPTVNLVIAFLAFATVFATYGYAGDRTSETTIAVVQGCVIPPEEDGRECTAAEVRDSPTPAYAAGIRSGDRIVSFNGTEITSWEQVQRLVRANGDGIAEIVVERDGALVPLSTNTTVTPRFLEDDDAERTEVGFLGVTPVTHPTTGGPLYTLEQMGHMTVDVAEAIVTLPAKVWGVAKAIVGLEERDINGPVSIVGGGRIAGETAADDRISTTEKIVSLGMIIGGFNLFIGMFNFIPLLPLDGGRIATALWQGIRRTWARLRRRPDPGYVDGARLLPITYVVALSIMVMGVVLIVGDVVVPIRLPS